MEEKITLNKNFYKQTKQKINNGEIDITNLDAVVLAGLMDYETDMLCVGEGDVELIEKCSSLLDEKRAQPMTHGNYVAAIHKAKGKSISNAKGATSRKSLVLKRAIIIAATIAVLATVCTAVASALGFDVFYYISKVIKYPNGTEITANGVSFYVAGTPKEYQSVEDALDEENLHVMYPAALPDGVKVKNVYVVDRLDRGDQNIQIITYNSKVTVSIITGINSPNELGAEGTMYKCGDMTYKLFESDRDDNYHAFCHYGDCDYSIVADTYEDLIFVINNMQETR